MPPLPGVYGAPASPPIGLGYSAEFLTHHKVENDVLDMRFPDTNKWENLKDKIKEFNPDLIGFAVHTYRHDVPYSLVSEIKKLNPSIKIILGGPHASTIRAQILEESEADYALSYEAEKILLDLCNGVPLEEIKGLIYRDKAKIKSNQDAPFLDLNQIPFPKYEKFPLKKYVRKQINIASSRGCPYSCTFCSIKTTVGRPVRIRTPESVVEEIEYWYNKGYKDFDIIDDHFLHNKERVAKICDKLIESNMKDLHLICGNGIRADKVDREILKKMRIAGFKQFSIGVESSNNEVLKRMKKAETVEQIDNAIKLSCEAGIDVSLMFIVGMPGETKEDIKNSIKLAMKYPVNNANFYNPIPFLGTELYEYVKANNLFVVKHPDYLNNMAHFDDPIFETPEFPIKERKEMLVLTKKAEKEILRRTFARKLKKYSIIGEVSSHIIFFKPVYKLLQQANMKSHTLKKILVYLANRFDLRRMEAVR